MTHKENDVDEALEATARIFTDIKQILKDGNDTSADVSVPRQVLKDWKIQILAANKNINKHAKRALSRECRLKIEKQLIKAASVNECVDRAATQARVYERLRSNGEASQTHSGIDRAIQSASAIEEMLTSLTPTGRVNFHGAHVLLINSSN